MKIVSEILALKEQVHYVYVKQNIFYWGELL